MGYTRTTTISFPDNPSIDTSNMHIVSDSMSLDDILWETELEFGKLYSAKFEVEVFGLTQDVTGLKMRVSQTVNGTTTSVFTGFVDSCTKSGPNAISDVRKLVAYDALYKLSTIDVTTWWSTYWTNVWPTTTEDFWLGTSEAAGFKAQITGTVPVSSAVDTLMSDVGLQECVSYVQTTLIDDITVSALDVLSWLSICLMQLFHIDANGNLCYIDLFPTSESSQPRTLVNITNYYERNTSTFENYTTTAIDSVECYNEKNKKVGSAVTSGVSTPSHTMTFQYTIMPEVNGSWADWSAGLLNLVTGAVYPPVFVPAEINMIASQVVGGYWFDKILVTDKGNSWISQRTLSGPGLIEETYICEGNKVYNNASRVSSTNGASYTAVASTSGTTAGVTSLGGATGAIATGTGVAVVSNTLKERFPRYDWRTSSPVGLYDTGNKVYPAYMIVNATGSNVETMIANIPATGSDGENYLMNARTVLYFFPIINGNRQYRNSSTFYAPTTSGSTGQYLKATSSGAPVWSNVISSSWTIHNLLVGGTDYTAHFSLMSTDATAFTDAEYIALELQSRYGVNKYIPVNGYIEYLNITTGDTNYYPLADIYTTNGSSLMVRYISSSTTLSTKTFSASTSVTDIQG